MDELYTKNVEVLTWLHIRVCNIVFIEHSLFCDYLCYYITLMWTYFSLCVSYVLACLNIWLEFAWLKRVWANVWRIIHKTSTFIVVEIYMWSSRWPSLHTTFFLSNTELLIFILQLCLYPYSQLTSYIVFCLWWHVERCYLWCKTAQRGSEQQTFCLIVVKINTTGS